MLIKVLIVLLSISSWSLMGESSTQISPVETRRATKSCFCFHKPFSHTNINEVIDKNGNGLKRLVVYFYKDIKTNELKMYTPNIEKQRLMPNLAFEGGDYIYDIISEELFDIFNKNPNVIDTSSVYDKDFDITISKETLSNIGEIENNPANENGQRESNIDKRYERLIITNNQLIQNMKVPENNNGRLDNTYILPIKLQHHKTINKTLADKNMLTHNLNTAWNEISSTEIDNVRVQPENSYPNKSLQSGFLPIDATSQDSQDLVHLLDEPGQLKNLNDDRKHNIKILKENLNALEYNRPISSNKIQSKMENINTEFKLSNVYPVRNIMYSKSNYENSNVPNQKRSHLYPYQGNYFDVFDKWIKEQFKALQDIQTIDTAITDDFVRAMVQEILMKNGISVTSEGINTRDGVQLNINDLILRPFVVGDSVGSDKAYKEKKDSISPGPVFLKAVLILFANPPKILGVIPLGKTRDSNKSWKINTNNAISSNENVNSITDNKYLDLKFQVNSVQGVDKSDSNNYNDQTQNRKICKYKRCGNKKDKLSLGVEKINMSTRPKIEHEYAPHRERNKGKKGSKQKRVKSDHKLLMQKLHGAKKNDIVAKPGGFPLKRLLNKVLSFLTSEADYITGSPQNNKSEDEIAAFTLKEGDYEESEEVEDIEDVTDINYRIIGGRPAIGTGAPLNNRGKRFSNL